MFDILLMLFHLVFNKCKYAMVYISCKIKSICIFD